MKEMTISQLLCLTRAEILAIRSHLRAQLPCLPVGSPEFRAALLTLDNIETVLARPDFHILSAHALSKLDAQP